MLWNSENISQLHISKNPVRIVACYDEPLANQCFESYPWNCTFPGYEIEYIYTLINGMLKFPITWTRVDTYDDIEKLMDDNGADTVGVSFVISSKFSDRWGYLPAYMYDGLALVAKVQYADSSQPFQLLNSFTWDLWLAIIVTTLIAIGIRWASIRLVAKRPESNLNFSCKSAVSYLMTTFRVRIWYIVWFVLLSIILNFYSNLIAVTIVAPNTVKKIGFTSLTDLGEKLLTKKCRLIISEKYKTNSEIHDYLVNPIKQQNKTWTDLFQKAFKENPPIYAKSRESMADTILTTPCTVGVDWMTLDVYYTTYYCDLNVVTYADELPLFGYTFYNRRLDIQDSMATVISSEAFQTFTEYLTRKYYENKNPTDCSTKSKQILSDPTVPVSKVQDGFYMLAIGIIVAIVAIIVTHIKSFYARLKLQRRVPENWKIGAGTSGMQMDTTAINEPEDNQSTFL